MKIDHYFEEIAIPTTRRVVLLDIDGTLTTDHQWRLSAEVQAKVAIWKRYHDVWLCTNSHHNSRNQQVADQLTLPLLNSPYRKPNKRLLEGLPAESREGRILVIGDKFLTDEKFARNIGAEYIRVRRRTAKTDRWIVWVIYLLDDFMYFFNKKIWRRT